MNVPMGERTSARSERSLEPSAGVDSSVEADLRALSLARLIEHVLDEHQASMRDALDRAMALANEVYRAHGATHPQLARIRGTVSELRYELLRHMMQEERVLFPYIEALERHAPHLDATIAATIARTRIEHAEAEVLLDGLRVLTSGFAPPRDADNRWRDLYATLQDLDRDLRLRILIEEGILFPRALGKAVRLGL